MKLKERINKDLKHIIKNTSIEESKEFWNLKSKYKTKWCSEKGSYVIKENKFAKKRFIDLIDFILKWKSPILKINESKLKDKLEWIIFDEFFEEKNKDRFLSNRINILLEELKKYENQIFFFRVHNLTTVKKIDFGKISILPSKKSFWAQLKSNLDKDSKMFGDLDIDEKNSCYAMIRTTENKDFAEKRAREELGNHLGMLSLMSGCALFLDGKIPSSANKLKYIENGGLKTSMKYPFASFLASPLHLKVFLNKGDVQKKSFAMLSKILKNNDLRLNNKIILSSKWYLEYIKELSVEQKILKLAIALEVLLIRGKEESSKMLNLSERISFLLYKKKKDRKEIFSKVNEFYLLRNDLVHGGKFKDNFRETLLNEISYLFRQTINKILVKKFNSIQEIDNFVQDKKFQ